MGMMMGAQMGAGPWGAPAAAPAAAPPAPPPIPAAVQWHVAENGATQGPFDLAGLQALVAQGRLGGATLVWSAGMAGWTPAAEVAALAGLLAAVPPPPPPPA
jgi:hypothetical protein